MVTSVFAINNPALRPLASRHCTSSLDSLKNCRLCLESPFLNECVDPIKALRQAWDWAVAQLKKAVKAAGDVAAALFDNVKLLMSALVNKIKAMFSKLLEMASRIGELVKSLGTLVAELAKGAFGGENLLHRSSNPTARTPPSPSLPLPISPSSPPPHHATMHGLVTCIQVCHYPPPPPPSPLPAPA